jgi:ketosteroid isomerase-like protein
MLASTKIMNLQTFLLVSLALTAAAQTPPDDASQIRATRALSNQALAHHDTKAFAETISPDFVIVRGNGLFVPSREAWLDDVATEFKNPNAVIYERTPEKIELSNVVPLAAEHGRWTAALPNGKLAYTGTYLAMWKHSAAGWQIRSELFVLLTCEDPATCAAYRKSASK